MQILVQLQLDRREMPVAEKAKFDSMQQIYETNIDSNGKQTDRKVCEIVRKKLN